MSWLKSIKLCWWRVKIRGIRVNYKRKDLRACRFRPPVEPPRVFSVCCLRPSVQPLIFRQPFVFGPISSLQLVCRLPPSSRLRTNDQIVGCPLTVAAGGPSKMPLSVRQCLLLAGVTYWWVTTSIKIGIVALFLYSHKRSQGGGQRARCFPPIEMLPNNKKKYNKAWLFLKFQYF